MEIGKLGLTGHIRRPLNFNLLRLIPVLLVALCASPLLAQTQPTPAAFIEPVDGAVLDPNLPIRWTAQPDALAYYLYVGTAPGLKDLINSRETQATEWSARSLPVGNTLYARIHTKYASGWVNSTVSFTLKPVSVFINPAANGATVNPNFRFEWTAVANAEAYFLYVGSAPGLHDYVSTGEIDATHYSANGLPAGRRVYARLHVRHGGAWRYTERTLDVAPIATFITPLDNDLNADPRANLRWRAVEAAQSYYLYVGTARGRKDLIDSRETLATSWPATFIPAGETVYARLHTKHGGVWRYTDISFRLAPQAVFIEPAADDTEIDPREPLMWTDVPSAQAYFLYVGTAPGEKDVVDSGEIGDLSFDISVLPRGRTLYATLHTKAGGAWRSVQRSFRIRPVATLLDRPDAPSKIDTRTPLRWVAVEGTSAYYLYVGSAPGAKDLINSGEIQATQFSISKLPAGRTVYVRLFTKHGGAWRYVDSTLKTKSVAYLSGSVESTGAWQPATPLTWAAYAGASKYYVYVGSAPGLLDISSSGETAANEFTMPLHHAAKIQSDQTVHVRLYSLVEGHWEFVDYAVEFHVAAQLNFPKNGAANVGVTAVRMTWNEITGATGYRLQLGTAPGVNDLLSTEPAATLVQHSGALPGGVTIHARLWTEIAGEWRYSDSTFTTRAASALVHPSHGQVNVDVGRPIEWTSVAGADLYRVEIGSSPGGRDLLDTGLTAETSVDAPAAMATATGVIYGRVWTRHLGTWRFSDAIFATSGSPGSAAMVWETSSNAFAARDAFRWTTTPLARSYHLRIGTTPGGNDVHDSGSIRTARRLVDNLPEATQLYGSLEITFLDGSGARTDFEFTVADASIDFADRWNHALWATAEVRGMAQGGNVPLPNTLLLDTARLQLRESALCTTYAMAELELIRQSGLGLDARILNVCLIPNRFDCHTLIEVLRPETASWLILDPTFGMAVQRTDDGEWATSMDLFDATRNGSFDAMEYVPLTDQGLSFAQNYYLDYPLLYANVYQSGSSLIIASSESVLPRYDLTATNIVSESGLYAIRCLEGSDSALIRVTGTDGALPVDDDDVALVSCDGNPDRLSHVFRATSIEPADETGAFEVVVPKRFVFD